MLAYLREDAWSEATMIFALAMVCYTANGKSIGSGDTLPARYLPFGVLRQGSFYLDDYPLLHRGKAYSIRRIGDHDVSFYRGSRLYIRNWPLWQRSRSLLRIAEGRVAVVSSPR
jgi:hypothetical protein